MVGRLGVAAGRPAGDDEHGYAACPGPADEPVAAHDGERGPEDEQGRRALDEGVAALDPVLGDRAAEEDDVRLERVGAARPAHGQDEAGHGGIGQDDVTVGADLARHPRAVGDRPEGPLGEAGVGLGHPALEHLALAPSTAGEADDVGERAVQLDDAAGPGLLVQAVDVLGDDRADEAPPLERGHRLVADVGPGGREPLPADEAAGPVPPARLARPDELAVRHRHDPPAAVRTAVVGDAGLGRDPGPGEDEGGRPVRQHPGHRRDIGPRRRRDRRQGGLARAGRWRRGARGGSGGQAHRPSIGHPAHSCLRVVDALR